MREVFEYTHSGRRAPAASSPWAPCIRCIQRLGTAAEIARAGRRGRVVFDKNSALPMTLYSVQVLKVRSASCASARVSMTVASRRSCSRMRRCAARTSSLPVTVREVLACHPYPPAVARVLGELLAACALLASTIKFEGSLIAQLSGDGPVRAVVGMHAHARHARDGAMGRRAHCSARPDARCPTWPEVRRMAGSC
jgi:hypothetical protein